MNFEKCSAWNLWTHSPNVEASCD